MPRFKLFSFYSLAILLVLFLVLGRFSSSISYVEDRAVHAVLSPVFSLFSKSTRALTGFFYRAFNGAKIDQENESLKNEVSQLRNELRQREEEKLSFDRLNALLHLDKTQSHRSEIARVLSYDSIPGVKSILINKGSDAGVQKGQAVINLEGVVGLVVKVSPQDARVILLIDPAFVIEGELRPSGARGILHGRRNELDLKREFWLTRMEYLGHSDEVHEKDLVLSSGLDRVFPEGVLIGEVQKVKTDDKGMFLSAEVLPAVDFSKLKEVIVIIGNAEK